MIPGIEKLVGKGDASRGIHKQILLHLPNHYLPIVKRVNKGFNELVKELPTTLDQEDLIIQAIIANDVKSLSYYVTKMRYDMTGWTKFAFLQDASVETIVFLTQHDMCLRNHKLIQYICKYNKLDVFKSLEHLAWDPQWMIRCAVQYDCNWPLEWMISKNINVLEEVAFDRLNCHISEEWPSYRRIILFIIQHYEISYNDCKHEQKETTCRLLDLLATVFQDCCESDRLSDVTLFEHFYWILTAHYKFEEWVPINFPSRYDDRDEDKLKPCLSWIESKYLNVPEMMDILNSKDCDCGEECARKKK